MPKREKEREKEEREGVKKNDIFASLRFLNSAHYGHGVL
jgi:hypothetical protein